MPHCCSTRTDWSSVVRRQLQSTQDSLVALKDAPAASEALHDARVAIRRAESMLRIARDLLADRHVDWLRTRLRRLRRACNFARDNDVLRKWLKDRSSPTVDELRRSLKRERRASQSRIVELTHSLIRRHRLTHHAKQALQGALHGGGSEDKRPVVAVVARRLLDELNQFVRALSTEATGSRQLHRLRIAGKRLRYGCEFVAEVIPDAGLDSLQQLLTQIQDRLGKLHDAFVREKSLKAVADREVRTTLLRDSADERDQLTKEWQRWWTLVLPASTIGSATTRLIEMLQSP